MPDPTPDTPVTRQDLADMIDQVDDKLDQLLEDDEPPVDPPHRVLIGGATWTAPEMRQLEAALAGVLDRPVTLAAQRDFAQAGPWDVNQIPRVVEDKALGRMSLLSWKAWPTDAQLDQVAETLDGHPASLAFFHEPTNPSKGIDPVQYNAELLPRFKRIRSWGVPSITSRQVFMGFDTDPTYGTPRIEHGWLDSEVLEYTDVLSFDLYNPYGYHGSTRWIELEQLLAWTDPYVEAHGFAGRVGIDESACPEDGGDKPAWLRNGHAAMLRRKIKWFVCYDVEQGEIACTPGHRAASSPEALAALAEMVALGAP